MRYSFIPTSFVDSPYGSASVVFADACNLKCSYCYQVDLFSKGDHSLEEVCDLVVNHRFENNEPKTDWLILSGGEITVNSSDIAKLIQIGYSTGRKVGIYTNGTLTDYNKASLSDKAGILLLHNVDFINVDYKFEISNVFDIKSVLVHLYPKYNNKLRLTTVLLKNIHSYDYMDSMAKDIEQLLHIEGTNNKINWRFVSFKYGKTIGNVSIAEEVSNTDLSFIIIKLCAKYKWINPILELK